MATGNSKESDVLSLRSNGLPIGTSVKVKKRKSKKKDLPICLQSNGLPVGSDFIGGSGVEMESCQDLNLKESGGFEFEGRRLNTFSGMPRYGQPKRAKF